MTTTRQAIAEDGAGDGALPDGVCCAACAVREAEPAAPSRAALASLPVVPPSAGLALPVLDTAAGRPRTTIARDADRRVTAAGLGLAGVFFGLAILGLAHLVVGRTGIWVPLHLALAGGASTAIASVMPFFSAALAGAPPVAAHWRGLAIALVACGALVVSVALPAGWTTLALGAGSAYVTGIGLVAVVSLWPLRAALGVRRPLVELAYVVALVHVAAGATLALAFVAALPAVTTNWALLKPAHAWLNLFGFLTVVIAASLVHLAPTVAGNRIKPRHSAVMAIAGLVAGPPLVAAGLILAADAVVRLGAVIELLGAAALLVHAVAVHRYGGAWTTDPGWHRLTNWSLAAATGWLFAAVAVAAGRLLWLGADPSAWSMALIAAPFALGFVVQVVLGSWSHLVPAIGPGDMAGHARQRVALGQLATTRIATLNAGVGVAWLGTISGVPLATAAGLGLAGASIVGTLLLLAWSAAGSRRVRIAAA